MLLRSGVKCEDERTVRLVSLAAGKFLEDLIDETCLIQENRSQATIKHQQNEGFPKDRKPVILTEDLSLALQRVRGALVPVWVSDEAHALCSRQYVLFSLFHRMCADGCSMG